MLKVGLVGVGGISGAHIPVWEAMENAELVALCDIRPERMEKYEGKRCYLDFDEMLANEERNIAINALANISGVSPSTIYSMLNEKSKNPGVVSIKKICDGLEISIREFFDSDLFDDLEQEIK